MNPDARLYPIARGLPYSTKDCRALLRFSRPARGLYPPGGALFANAAAMPSPTPVTMVTLPSRIPIAAPDASVLFVSLDACRIRFAVPGHGGCDEMLGVASERVGVPDALLEPPAFRGLD